MPKIVHLNPIMKKLLDKFHTGGNLKQLTEALQKVPFDKKINSKVRGRIFLN